LAIPRRLSMFESKKMKNLISTAKDIEPHWTIKALGLLQAFEESADWNLVFIISE